MFARFSAANVKTFSGESHDAHAISGSLCENLQKARYEVVEEPVNVCSGACNKPMRPIVQYLQADANIHDYKSMEDHFSGLVERAEFVGSKTPKNKEAEFKREMFVHVRPLREIIENPQLANRVRSYNERLNHVRGVINEYCECR